MASIKRRPNGVWRARYRDGDGREHSRHFARRVDAQRWLDEVTASVLTGQYVDPRAGRIRFQKYAETWRTTVTHGPTTRNLVERTLRLHVYPVLGDQQIGSIRPTAVQSLVTTLGTTLAPRTVQLAYGYVVAIFHAAVRDKVVAASPCTGVRMPALRGGPVEIPPLSVLPVLVENLPDRFKVIPMWVIGSGLRPSEAFGLERRHVGFLRDRAVDVRQQLVRLGREPSYLGQPKTAKSRRTVPLASATLDALSAHLAEFPAREVEIDDRTDPRRSERRVAELLFTHENGQPVARHEWSKIWRPAARAAKLPERTGLHIVRHMYASVLIRAGESVKVMQERLGHSSAVTTLNTYAHLFPDSADRTRKALESALVDLAADSLRTADNGR
jgi:integrase